MIYDNSVVSLSPTLNGRKDGPYCMVFAYFIENGGLTIFQVPPGEKVTSEDNLWDESIPTGYWRKAFVNLKTMDTFQVSLTILDNTPVGRNAAFGRKKNNIPSSMVKICKKKKDKKPSSMVKICKKKVKKPSSMVKICKKKDKIRYLPPWQRFVKKNRYHTFLQW